MRRLIEWCLVSADGIVLDDPFPFKKYQDSACLLDARGLFEACDATLWGRTTYERFARIFPDADKTHPYAARLNAIRKYVFSSKLETGEWNNSTIVRGDLAAEVRQLKQQNGGDLLILGHGRLGETLLNEQLLDMINLDIYPVLLGHGRPLFREGQAAELQLTATKTFSKIVKVSYELKY